MPEKTSLQLALEIERLERRVEALERFVRDLEKGAEILVDEMRATPKRRIDQ
jgi:hypothetical protein